MQQGNGRLKGNGGDQNGARDDGYTIPPPKHPLPPPEAFRQLNGVSHPPEPETQDDNLDENNERTANRGEAAAAEAASSITVPRRPSQLIRRQSSLFGKLPVRSNSLLFGDAVNGSSSNIPLHNTKDYIDTLASETAMTSTTINFSQSQSTWLQNDHESTLLGGSQVPFLDENKSDLPQLEQQQEQQNGNSSLFGAVMRQFSTGISSAFPIPPSSPFGRKPSRSVGSYADSSPQKKDVGVGGGFRSLIASPSGKTIMNIVNQFNSPFKFQSPSSSDRKRRAQRRRLWKDDEEDEKSTGKSKDAGDAYTTPTKRRRMGLNYDDENSKPSINNLFSDHGNSDSRSSLGGGIVDESWREAPIVGSLSYPSLDNDPTRMEFLDWSLPTKLRIEVNGGTLRQKQSRNIVHSWVRDVMRDNADVVTCWIYSSPVLPSNDVTGSESGGFAIAQQGFGLLSRSISTSNLSAVQRSIATKKSTMSRQDSFSSSRFDPKPKTVKGKASNNGKSDCETDSVGSSNASNRLAKFLIRSVRGPRAKYSRKRVLEEHCWWDEQATDGSRPTLTHDDRVERLQRRWQQAIRSLYSNFRRRAMSYGNQMHSANAMVLDTYFYCIGQDHSVLFRVAAANDSDGDNEIRAMVPVVLISSTSEAFRKQLEQNGLDMSFDNSGSGDETVRFLESIQEREARERRKVAAAVKVNKKLFDKAILSPGVKADLEALRRAQAFGEAAGADVMVKVSKSDLQSENQEKANKAFPKALRISGWDNVSLFFEVYWNQCGDTMGIGGGGMTENGLSACAKSTNQRLPLLICPNTKGISQFEHASMKRLRVYPVETMQTADGTDNKGNIDSQSLKNGDKAKAVADQSNGVEIRGILLPCMARKLLLLARKQILEDEKQSSAISSATALGATNQNHPDDRQQKDEQDASRYVVLHSIRPNPTSMDTDPVQKSLIGGLSGTLVFNQGKVKRNKARDLEKNDCNQNPLFECYSGKVVSMAVWDASREEVAACKLDDAFPANWYNNKS